MRELVHGTWFVMIVTKPPISKVQIGESRKASEALDIE
jgi:hypothetical protein